MKKSFINNGPMLLVACLTLGLAPFTPPHIVGKLQWIAGGAAGMQFMDWFDVVLHGTPWVLLLRYLLLKGWAMLQRTRAEKGASI